MLSIAILILYICSYVYNKPKSIQIVSMSLSCYRIVSCVVLPICLIVEGVNKLREILVCIL